MCHRIRCTRDSHGRGAAASLLGLRNELGMGTGGHAGASAGRDRARTGRTPAGWGPRRRVAPRRRPTSRAASRHRAAGRVRQAGAGAPGGEAPGGEALACGGAALRRVARAADRATGATTGTRGLAGGAGMGGEPCDLPRGRRGALCLARADHAGLAAIDPALHGARPGLSGFPDASRLPVPHRESETNQRPAPADVAQEILPDDAIR